MGQVTIYLDDDIEEKMKNAAKSSRLSKSKWVASLIREKVAREWPRSIIDLAGSWKDLSLAEEGRAELGCDAEREKL